MQADINGVILKNNDLIVVNTIELKNEYATVKEKENHFTVIYQNREKNGKITKHSFKTVVKNRCIRIVQGAS